MCQQQNNKCYCCRQGRREGVKGNTCWRNADSSFFFFIPLSSRDLCAYSGSDYIWPGWVYYYGSHDKPVGERGKA